MPRRSSGAPPQLEKAIHPGLSAAADLEVTEADTAESLGSGSVPVLATPRLIGLCEEASWRAVEGHLGVGRTSVATSVQFDHLIAVAVGAKVSAEATLARVEGRRLIFTLSAALVSDGHAALVGAGRLTRVVVERSAFLAKAGASPPS